MLHIHICIYNLYNSFYTHYLVGKHAIFQAIHDLSIPGLEELGEPRVTFVRITYSTATLEWRLGTGDVSW